MNPKLLLILIVLTLVTFASGVPEKLKKGLNKGKKLRLQVKTGHKEGVSETSEKFHILRLDKLPSNVWVLRSRTQLERKKRRNLIVRCCGRSRSCLDTTKSKNVPSGSDSGRPDAGGIGTGSGGSGSGEQAPAPGSSSGSAGGDASASDANGGSSAGDAKGGDAGASDPNSPGGKDGAAPGGSSDSGGGTADGDSSGGSSAGGGEGSAPGTDGSSGSDPAGGAAGGDPAAPSAGGTASAGSGGASGSGAGASGSGGGAGSDSGGGAPSLGMASGNGSSGAAAGGDSKTTIAPGGSGGGGNGSSANSTTKGSADSGTGSSSTTTTGQPTTTKPPFLCQRPCQKKDDLFDAKGNVKNAAGYGFWLQLCNDSLLFGNRLVNWTDNHDVCCSLGMKPLYLLDQIDNNCLQDYIYSSWGLNYNYWSGGIKSKTLAASWCPGNASQPGEHMEWESDRKTQFDCVKMKILNAKSVDPMRMLWSFKNCTALSLLACKVSLFKGPNTSLSKPEQYGNWFKHANYTFLFGLPANWSYAHKTCGRLGMKLISFNKLELVDYLRAITKNYSEFANRTYWTSGYDWDGPGKYKWCTANDSVVEKIDWKDGKEPTSAGCIRIFFPRKPTKAPGSDPIPNVPNVPNMGRRRKRQMGPSLTTPTMPTIPTIPTTLTVPTTPTIPSVSSQSSTIVTNPVDAVVNILTNKTEENDEASYKPYFELGDCDKNHTFICAAKAMPTPMQKQKDCMATFNISQAEIDTILTAKSYSAALKCFMRCMGEDLNLLVDGLPGDIDLVKLMEESADSDAELDKNLDIYDICGKEKGADACETSAKVFQCGVDKDPAAMTKLVEDSAANKAKKSQTENIVGPVLAACDPIPCNSEPNFVTKRLTKENDLITGSYFITACGKVYYVARVINAQNFDDSHKYCCKFGMRLASVETKEEAMCIGDAIQHPMNPYRAMAGLPLRLFGTNKDVPSHPVWCPKRSPVDMMLFYPLFYVPNMEAIGFTILGGHPVTPPLFAPIDKSTPIDFLCEDPE